jgi:antitoxin component of RelBE/YafQ-DinJ toxin-antitoxin module
MTNLTIRIDELLKKQALKEAMRLGIPLTLVIKNALKNFVQTPRVIIGEPEDVEVTKDMQKKMDKVAYLLSTR